VCVCVCVSVCMLVVMIDLDEVCSHSLCLWRRREKGEPLTMGDAGRYLYTTARSVVRAMKWFYDILYSNSTSGS